MRRFLLKCNGGIEGVLFSDCSLVIHGSFFHHSHVASLSELKHMFRNVEIVWLDAEEILP